MGKKQGAKCREAALHRHTINDEAGALREAVVHTPRRGIGFLRMPVEALYPGSVCLVPHGKYQGRADAAAALLLRREQVLQIADGFDVGRAAVEQVMHYADDPTVAFGDAREHGFAAIEKTAPG